MKSWFIVAIVLGGLYYYATHTEGGKQQFDQLAHWFQQWTGQTAGDEKTTVYKTQNPDGTWAYSNDKPKASGEATEQNIIKQEYRSDTNVLPSLTNHEPKAKD